MAVTAIPVAPKPIMIYGFIRATLGTAGSAVLDFYVANSLWVNGLIFIYALLVVLARRTFDQSRESLVATLQSQYGTQFEQKRPGSILKTLGESSIPWDQALRRSSYPFMTPPGSIWIYPKNLATFQRFLPLEKLAELLKES